MSSTTPGNGVVPTIIDGPYSKEPRGVGLDKQMLEDLEAARNVRVFSALCNQDWPLAEQQANNTRKAIARTSTGSREGTEMAIYFTIRKSQTESLTVIFDSDGLERAKRYKHGLVSARAYREEQITISRTDPTGRLVQA